MDKIVKAEYSYWRGVWWALRAGEWGGREDIGRLKASKILCDQFLPLSLPTPQQDSS